MDLITQLQDLERIVLRVANAGMASYPNDVVMKLWSAEWPWFTLAAFFLLQTAYRRQWQEFKTLLWMSATVGVTDIFAAQILKPWIGRIRPCKVEDLVRIVDGCAGSLSFPSNHAANAAAFAVFWFLWKGPRFGVLALACMTVVGFSRVYLGNHYPSDVLGGFLLGTVVAVLSFSLHRKFLLNNKKSQA